MSTTAKQLHLLSTTILEDGGEGVMLRAPGTLYQRGLSVDLLKLKAQRDYEALVVDFNGDYELELPDGTRFRAPAAPGVSVSVGDVVTFTYSASKNEQGNKPNQSPEDELRGEREGWIPLDPVIVHARKDMIWEEMVSHSLFKPRERNANSLTQRLLRETKTRHPVGHWTIDDNKNAKELFKQYARSRNGNAQDPEFWYSVKRSDLLTEKRATTIVKNYGGSCAKAVLDLFPDIGLDRKRLFAYKKPRRKLKSKLQVNKYLLKTVKTPMKTSAIMRVWWKVHKNSVA